MHQQVRRNKDIAFSGKYHVIGCPKYRRPVLAEDVAMRLRQIALDLAGELKPSATQAAMMGQMVGNRR